MHATDGWPKRVGKQLFCRTSDHTIQWLGSTLELFTWLKSQFKVNWGSAGHDISKGEFFTYLTTNCVDFDAVETIPHQPLLPRTCYVHPPLPTSDGACFQGMLNRFSPATETDAQLLEAFVLSLFWGGPPGTRPGWLFTGVEEDNGGGIGIGKSSIVELVSELVDGVIEISPNENMSTIKTRLFSSAARHLRIARIDNIKEHAFSWSDLEGLITSPIISGRRLYEGEGRRPNTLTWTLTLNRASLSRDMAARCVIVQLQRPLAYSPDWKVDLWHYIRQHKWEIIAEVVNRLTEVN